MVADETFSVGCIEFGYSSSADAGAEVSISVYIDTDGGAPDRDNMELVYTYDAFTTINDDTVLMGQVTSSSDVDIVFASSVATLVVVMNHPNDADILGQGQYNPAANPDTDSVQTWTDGTCLAGPITLVDSNPTYDISEYDPYQWQVQVTKGGPVVSDNDASGYTSMQCKVLAKSDNSNTVSFISGKESMPSINELMFTTGFDLYKGGLSRSQTTVTVGVYEDNGSGYDTLFSISQKLYDANAFMSINWDEFKLKSRGAKFEIDFMLDGSLFDTPVSDLSVAGIYVEVQIKEGQGDGSTEIHQCVRFEANESI
jgi:hypothetical protein